jgi:pimeloyl-ACP methyl ester carboxylesterase
VSSPKHRLVIATIVAALSIVAPPARLSAQQSDRSIATETRIPVGTATLYSRALGVGTPVIVLHGGPAYQAGDPETVATRYRIHFQPSLKRPADYERMMARMRTGFISQGKGGILKARAVEDQLMRDTWEVPGYDLLPRLAGLGVPTLVIAGDHDFMVGAARGIAGAIPRAQLVTVEGCGHFAFLECAAEVRSALNNFVARPR